MNELNNEKLQEAQEDEERESPMLVKLRSNFEFFGLLSFIYGILFVFSFYKNLNGFTYLFFVIVTLGACVLVCQKLKLDLKKESYLYIAGILLLGISNIFTYSAFLYFFNTSGILLLLILFALTQMYQTKNWSFIQYISNIFLSFCYAVASIGLPFLDTVSFFRDKNKFMKNKAVKNILIGVLFAIPVVFIILVLLAQADMVFKYFTKDILNSIFQFFTAELIGKLSLIHI